LKANSSPQIVVRLLSALKGFFTFKELEKLLGVPLQMLWRYTSLQAVPERTTANRIMQRIEDLRLIEKILDEVIKVNKYGFIETWRYSSNIYVLNILGYLAHEFVANDDIDVVLAVSEEALPIATVIADWIKANVCSTSRELCLNIEKYLVDFYPSSTLKRIVPLLVPRDLLSPNTEVLLVDDLVNTGASLNAALRLIRSAHAKPWGVFAVVSLNTGWLSRLREMGVNHIYVARDLSNAGIHFGRLVTNLSAR